MERTRHPVALARLVVSCVFALVAIGTGRPAVAGLVGALFVTACAGAAAMTRPDRSLGS